MKRLVVTCGMLLGLLCISGMDASAQPNLNFNRIVVYGSTIELYFGVGCDGKRAYNMSKQDFRVFDDSARVRDFTYWCPDPTVRCAISASLVFDASGSMSGSGNAGAKAAGRTFVDAMDGHIDEAAVLSFNTNVTMEQQTTTRKPLLYSAIDSLPASGGTAVWDGTYAGITEMINNGVNQCRAVIVLTDGNDNSSTRTPGDIISLANRNRIRVFTIGLGSSINAADLEMIAVLTGGRYYQTPDARQLAAIYKDISTTMFQGFNECVITYESGCMDGSIRQVELRLEDFCGGNDTRTKSYQAPLDSSSYSRLTMDLGDAEGRGNEDITLPLNLLTPVDPQAAFRRLAITLQFDSQYVQLTGAEAPPGSLLEGCAFDVTAVPGGARVSTRDAVMVKGDGLLMNLEFRAGNLQDTTSCSIDVTDASFSEGCFTPAITGGTIRVVPAEPLVSCDIDMPSRLSWSETKGDYDQNPFTVTSRFSNVGGKAAEGSVFILTYDSTRFTLVSPTTDTLMKNPADIEPGQYFDISWQVAAYPSPNHDSASFCISGSFDNHESITCCNRLFIPRRDSDFSCSVEVPEVHISPDSMGYAPMPFTVRAGLQNGSSMPSGMVKARIHVPDGFTLTGSSGERQEVRTFSPSTLPPGQQGFVEWYLEHPVTPREVTETIRVDFFENDVLACASASEVTIPVLDLSFSIVLTRDGPLTFCEGDSVTLTAPAGYDSYRWSTGHEGQSLVVDTSSMYFCTVTNSLGRTGYSDTLQVQVHPRPRPQIVVQGDIPLCEGDSLMLEADAGYRSYLWSTGATSRRITVKQAGSYHVLVDDERGCIGSSDTLGVEMYPSPPKPLITRTGDSLTTVQAPNYQWYFNGQPLPGDTNRHHQATRLGIYQVAVRNQYGCTSFSDEFSVNVLRVGHAELPESPSITVYPDPVSGTATLKLSMPRSASGSIWLVDVLGHTTRIGSLNEKRTRTITLDMSDRVSGFYHIVVLTGRDIHTAKFMKR